MHKSLNIDAATLAQYCEKNYIRRLALDGSQTQSTASPDSDIDRLVEFDTAHIPGLMGIAGMEIELSELLGHKVD